MSWAELRPHLEELAKGQGLYGRLLRDFDSAPKSKQQQFVLMVESQNFGDVVDFIMWYEG